MSTSSQRHDRELKALEELTLDTIYEQLGKERWKPNPNRTPHYLGEVNLQDRKRRNTKETI